MTTSTVNYYRPYVAVTRNVATVAVTAGDYPAPEQILDPDTGEPFLDPETGDPFLLQEGFDSINGAAVSAGVRVRRVGNDYVARPLRQTAIIETSVQYVATMRWRRQVVEIDTPELAAVDDGGSGVAAMGLTAEGVGYVVKSGSGIGTAGLTAEAEGEAPVSAEGSGIAALGATAEAVGSSPNGGSGVGAATLTAEAVGSKPSGGAGPAAMTLTAEGEGEAPAGSSLPVVESVATATTGSATSITFNKPTGTTSGEDLFALVQLSVNRTLVLPSGWVSVWDQANALSGKAALIRLRTGGSEPSTYTIGFSALLSEASVTCLRISGANATTPVDVYAIETSGTSVISPTVTTTVDNCLILRSHSTPRDRTISAPAGTTQQSSIDGLDASQSCATESKTTAGATGTATFSYASGTVVRTINGTLAIAPI